MPTRAWSAPDVTANEIARITLLRVLFLQRATRQAARHHDGEASAMLARASLEATIAGVFCVYVPGAERYFDGESVKRTDQIFTGIAEVMGLKQVLQEIKDKYEKNSLPPISQMVKTIEDNAGNSMGALYADFYVQLSSLYIHGGPLALLRHVHSGTLKTRERPYSAWNRRSAVHLADAMVGLLASTIAGENHRDQSLFEEYRAIHLEATWKPVTFVLLNKVKEGINLRNVSELISLVRRMRERHRAGEVFDDTDVEDFVITLATFISVELDEDALAILQRYFKSLLVYQ